MRKRIPVLILGALAAALLTGCSGSSEYEEPEEPVYEAPGNLYYVLNENNEAEIVAPPSYVDENYSYNRKPSATGDVVIPEEINGAKVSAIHSLAFKDNENITSVTIPGTVKTIGDSAFSGCDSLSQINIDYGVEEIGESAFNGAVVTQVSIPDSVRTVGRSAFGNCSELTYVNYNGVCDVDSVFYKTQWLELYGKLHGSDEFYIINGTLINYNGSSETVKVPDGVIAIGNSAFSCSYDETSNLAYVELPDTVEYIYDRAFWGCNNLVSINIPDSVTKIGDSAFVSCHSLTDIDLPDSLTIIGNDAFRGCTSLTEINIPYGVTEIGSSAFSECTSLSEINLPDTLTTIGAVAFLGCERLNDIVFPESLEFVGADVFLGTPLFDRKSKGDFLIIDDVLCAYFGDSDVVYIPDGVRVVTGKSLHSMYGAYSVIFPESVEIISNVDYIDFPEICFKGKTKLFDEYEYNVSIANLTTDIYLNVPMNLEFWNSCTVHYNGKMYSGTEYMMAYKKGLL